MELSFTHFRDVNTTRALIWHPEGIQSWSIGNWVLAMCGEAGEAANAAKKLHRLESGLQDHSDHPATLSLARKAIGLEVADTVIYADLVATRLGCRLQDLIIAKFNSTSEREGFAIRL